MFDSLESVLIDIRNKVEIQGELLQIIVDSLSTRKAVARFLNKTPKTIGNMIKDGRFQLGREYFYNKDAKIEFIPKGIIEYKKQQKFKTVVKVKEAEKILHPVSSKFIGASNG